MHTKASEDQGTADKVQILYCSVAILEVTRHEQAYIWLGSRKATMHSTLVLMVLMVRTFGWLCKPLHGDCFPIPRLSLQPSSNTAPCIGVVVGILTYLCITCKGTCHGSR
jgi:hypothetical protein